MNDNVSEKRFMVQYFPPVPAVENMGVKGSRFYALIIGVNHYQDESIPDLDNPTKDAERLYNILTTKYVFDTANTIFIRDARRADIIDALDHLAKIVSPSDNVLIFYAGHGWWDREANIGYWLPADARKESKADWFSNSRLVDYLRAVRSKHTLLIADACFTGAIFKTRSAFDDAPRAIAKLYELPSRKAMTSGTLTEVPDHSAFMKYLCERLEQNQKKYLSSEQLFSSFRLAVINNSDAIPQYGEIRNVGDEGGDFIFIRRNP